MTFIQKALQFFRQIPASFLNSRWWSRAKKWLNRFSITRLEAGLATVVSLLFRLGALALILGFVVMLWKIFKNEGYTIESFNVCQPLVQQGYDGVVVARHLQDEVERVKKIAASVKEDSVKMTGGEEPELNVAVLGVGFSLKSIGYHLRDLLGRKNNLIRGEITRVDSTLGLTLRMTGYEPRTFMEDLSKGERRAVSRLLRQAAEAILGNTDPYRLAIYHTRQMQFEEGLNVVRNMFRERPGERHWAMMAWGAILEDQGETEAAASKFRESIRYKPDFALPYMRLATCLQQMDKAEEAAPLIEKAMALNPKEIWYLNAYAFALNKLKRFDEADRAMERMLASGEMEEMHPVWLLNWAEMKSNRGDEEGAKKALSESIALSDPQSLENALSRLFLGLVNNDTQAVALAAREALAMEPNNGFARQAVMRSHFLKKEYARVIELALQVRPHPENQNHLQSIFNLAAMSFNFTGRHDSAFVYAQRSILENPAMGTPYSTLAETYAFTGDERNFFHYLEVAFQKGMLISVIGPKEEPYIRFQNHPEYLALLKKYSNRDSISSDPQ